MSVFYLRVSCGLVLFALNGCGAAPSPPTAAAQKSMPPSEQLSRLVERYWDEHVAPENQISPQLLANSLSIERRYLDEISTGWDEALDRLKRMVEE